MGKARQIQPCNFFQSLEIHFQYDVRVEGDKKGAKVQKLSKGEILMVNIGSLSTGGKVTAVKADLAKISLVQPVCTEIGEKLALSRRVDKHWRLIGWGKITSGQKLDTKNQKKQQK